MTLINVPVYLHSSLKDRPRSGRPLEPDIERLKVLIEDNPRLTTRELSSMLGCNQSTIDRHLHEMGKVNKLGTWVPHQLTSDNIQQRITICNSLLSQRNRYRFLQQIVTGDEKKQQSLHASKRYIWYILVGCDTYINPPYFLKQLEPYDFMQPYFIGGSFAEGLCYHKNKTTYRSQFIGGNSAYVFSTALVETLYPHLSPFVETVWPQPNHSSAAMSDIALSCLIISLGYKMTILSSFMRRSSKGIIEEFGLKNALRVREPSSWHYIHPLQMIDLDEFYAYHDVDRLMNDQKWMELVDFIRLLIGTHYETLRKHQPLDSHKLVRHYK
ncbi:unnamed protein product [Rotaria socialis]|uniref:Fringe-like glycosyltransferase domain-containing protein n=1 Tax=Rotaria socialis TaxID=392032 RepID=A0A818GJH3_9BILA|nr:unnamed protein product [Rotaria socialis]